MHGLTISDVRFVLCHLESDSWTDSYQSQPSEDSDHEIYEDMDKPVGIPLPVPAKRKFSKDAKKKLELDKKEQKGKQKRENEYRKRFKLNGPIEVIHVAHVREDWHGGKNDLSVQKGENVEIIRVNNNPEGKLLAQNLRGSSGNLNNFCVDVDYEEVMTDICGQANPSHNPSAGQTTNHELYNDIGSNDKLNSSFHSDDVYDDVGLFMNEEFPPPEISHDPKKAKQHKKEKKAFQKKFKFEGPIRALYTLNLKKGGSKDLAEFRGETSEKKALCRNNLGKYGFVPLNYLLQVEGDVYDDITASDIYDNDDS
ncbi:FYN-binding protein 1-like [Xyrauchen texanus]|uniref:FYN-binding protein 1-like n=1 Tax=Xyrauchen texanus TaxID=154827 RepID=UPI00224189C4|nr:FYN-binding protein 1-like [Xyrauchen texanus]